MMIKANIFLFILFVSLGINGDGEVIGDLRPTLISLGKDCEIASYLKIFNLRNEAYPFDWITSYDFSSVLVAIQSNFKEFFSIKCLKLNNLSIRNTCYNIDFIHDFPTSIDEKGQAIHVANLPVLQHFFIYMNPIREKYKRRMKRFNEALMSRKNIIFFRTGIGPAEAHRFVNIMKEKNPFLNYVLVVIHGKPELNYEWNIEHIKSFFCQKIGIENNINKWFDQEEWEKIFVKIGILQHEDVDFQKRMNY